MSDLIEAKVIMVQVAISIKRSAADIWALMFDEIGAWWMYDFRALGEGSTMTLNAQAGGQLIECATDGSSLEWYRAQIVFSAGLVCPPNIRISPLVCPINRAAVKRERSLVSPRANPCKTGRSKAARFARVISQKRLLDKLLTFEGIKPNATII